MIVYQQATTGKLHRRRSCSITSRTRYDHFPREFTAELRESCPRCSKCWDGFTPEPAAISGVIRRGDGGSAIRRAIERSARSSS